MKGNGLPLLWAVLGTRSRPYPAPARQPVARTPTQPPRPGTTGCTCCLEMIEMRTNFQDLDMKTKTLIAPLALLSLWAVAVNAQVSVSTVPSSGLAEPYHVVLDSANNLYVSDSVNNRIARIDANTQVTTTLAGLPADPAGSDDGFPYLAHFNDPQGLLTVTLSGVNATRFGTN